MKLSALAIVATVSINFAYAKNADNIQGKRRIKMGSSLKLERGWNVDKNEKREDNAAAPANPFNSLFGTFLEDFTMASRYISQGTLTGSIPDNGPSE